MVSPGRNHEVIQEGSEPDEFWNGLGGQGEYSKTLHNLDKPILEPRLFHCLELNGRFRALEIDDFDQKDLSQDSVLILDSGDEIYIWIGNEASDSDKENSLELAKVNMSLYMYSSSLFRNKRFMVDEMTRRNIQNLPYFIYMKIQTYFFCFSFRATLFFP